MGALKTIVLSAGSILGLSRLVLAILRSANPGGLMKLTMRETATTKPATQIKKWIFTSSLLAICLSACAPQQATREIASVDSANNSGIINGTEVVQNEKILKGIVAVYNAMTSELCTGSLLPNNVVLTAAHCIGEVPEVMFVLFDLKLSAASQRRQVTKMKVHPVWQYQIDKGRAPVVGDIALIQFEGTVPAGYEPATFLKDKSALADGAEVVIAGYGMFDGVKREGSGTLRQTVVTIAKADYNIIEIKLDQTKGTGACHGDSGGPAFILKDGQYHLWGITSRGSEDPNDDCSKYSIYTNALAFASWIQKVSTEFTTTPAKKKLQILLAGTK